MHLESRFDVLSVKSDDAPVDSNGDVKDEVGFERVDEGRAVHGQHGRCHVFIFDDFDVGAVGPSGLVAWEVPDGHVVSGLVQVDLEEVHVSPTVVVAGFQNEVVGVPGVHGLVPRAVPLEFVGVQETASLRVLDEEVANHRRLGRHGHVGDLVVVEARSTAVDRVSSEVVALDPQGHLTLQTFVGQIVVISGVVGRGSLSVAVQGQRDVLVSIGQTVAVGVVVVLNPKVEVEARWRAGQVLAGHADLLIGLGDHPCIIDQGSPVRVHVGVGSRTEHLDIEEVGLVGVDGDVERNGTGFVGVVLRRRAQQVAAFVATDGEAIGLAAGYGAKINVPVEVPADHTGAVGDLFPLDGDVAVGGVHVLEFEHEEVSAGVRSLVEVLKANLADEVDVLTRFCAAQGLRGADAVLQLEGRDARIVFDGITNRGVEEHGVGQPVHTVVGGQASVHANSGCVVPRGVHAEMPRDFLPVGDVGHGGRGFKLHVVVLIGGLSERHEFTPRELDEAGFGLERQPRLGQGCTGQGVDGVRGDDFVDVAVGVQADRAVGQTQGVGVAGAGGHAEVAQ